MAAALVALMHWWSRQLIANHVKQHLACGESVPGSPSTSVTAKTKCQVRERAWFEARKTTQLLSSPIALIIRE